MFAWKVILGLLFFAKTKNNTKWNTTQNYCLLITFYCILCYIIDAQLILIILMDYKFDNKSIESSQTHSKIHHKLSSDHINNAYCHVLIYPSRQTSLSPTRTLCWTALILLRIDQHGGMTTVISATLADAFVNMSCIFANMT